MLAAIAAQRGADAAQQKAQQLGLGADERRAALVAAVTYLDWARLYPQAKALLAAGGEGGEGDGNTAQAKAYIEALGKIQRYEDATCAPDDPRRPVQELCIGMLLGGKRKEQAKALFVKKATDEERLEAMRIVHAHFQPCRKSDPQHERPVQSSLDAVFMSTMAVVGDKEGGYRVDIRGPLVKAFACYTVFEEGAYRLLAHDGSPACLGAAALERLAAGDKRGAKQWLDWAWQEEQPEFAWFNPFTACRSPIFGGGPSKSKQNPSAWRRRPCCVNPRAPTRRLLPFCWRRKSRALLMAGRCILIVRWHRHTQTPSSGKSSWRLRTECSKTVLGRQNFTGSVCWL
jgi:hypothetical protein